MRVDEARPVPMLDDAKRFELGVRPQCQRRIGCPRVAGTRRRIARVIGSFTSTAATDRLGLVQAA